MLWAVLAVAVSAAPGQSPVQVASTYDEAACADGDKARPSDAMMDDGSNCSEAPPAPVPAVLDCNDARVSLWLGEMIGSCDMPRPQPPTGGPASLHAGTPSGEPRLCNDGHCGVDATPIRPAVRLFDDLTPALSNLNAAIPAFLACSVVDDLTLGCSQLCGRRLERPPRSR
jgi:hypothetical protein